LQKKDFKIKNLRRFVIMKKICMLFVLMVFMVVLSGLVYADSDYFLTKLEVTEKANFRMFTPMKISVNNFNKVEQETENIIGVWFEGNKKLNTNNDKIKFNVSIKNGLTYDTKIEKIFNVEELTEGLNTINFEWNHPRYQTPCLVGYYIINKISESPSPSETIQPSETPSPSDSSEPSETPSPSDSSESPTETIEPSETPSISEIPVTDEEINKIVLNKKVDELPKTGETEPFLLYAIGGILAFVGFAILGKKVIFKR